MSEIEYLALPLRHESPDISFLLHLHIFKYKMLLPSSAVCGKKLILEETTKIKIVNMSITYTKYI